MTREENKFEALIKVGRRGVTNCCTVGYNDEYGRVMKDILDCGCVKKNWGEEYEVEITFCDEHKIKTRGQ